MQDLWWMCLSNPLGKLIPTIFHVNFAPDECCQQLAEFSPFEAGEPCGFASRDRAAHGPKAMLPVVNIVMLLAGLLSALAADRQHQYAWMAFTCLVVNATAPSCLKQAACRNGSQHEAS